MNTNSISAEPLAPLNSEFKIPIPKESKTLMESKTPMEYITPTQRSTEWISCCFKMNTSAVKYFVQVSILSGLIIYSAVMLVVSPDCNSQRNYGSLLMICLGTFIPSPKIN